jgi:hypothetical protein
MTRGRRPRARLPVRLTWAHDVGDSERNVYATASERAQRIRDCEREGGRDAYATASETASTTHTRQRAQSGRDARPRLWHPFPPRPVQRQAPYQPAECDTHSTGLHYPFRVPITPQTGRATASPLTLRTRPAEALL